MADKDLSNEIVVTGALFALLSQAEGVTGVVPVMVDGVATNQLRVDLAFMASSYKLTVERIDPKTED